MTVFRPHSSHWGAFSGAWDGVGLSVRPHPSDPEPSKLLDNFTDALRHRARVARPTVRRGWLESGPGPDTRRGHDEWVELPWDEALDRLAAELARVRDRHGTAGLFGGSYGWASAGRFHHAQSQIHRFLNTVMGGHVRSVGSYSAGAAGVLLPHIMGPFEAVTRRNVTWDQIEANTDTLIAFGGMALRNMAVGAGGVSRHIERQAIAAARQRGARFILVSPLRSDLPEEAGGEWWPAVPGTDTALMLGLLHTLVSEGLHDREYLARYCAGWETLEDYVLGRSDGQAKDAAWAAVLCGFAAADIAALARRLAQGRTLVVVAHALQRAEHGEQPVWMGAALAAALGQIGLPGGGYNYALGTLAHYGRRAVSVPIPTLPQGANHQPAYIPVARISDMLLGPGTEFEFNGKRLTYPDARLVYWAGGNPFHHHQDLHRLAEAFTRPDTVVVHESVWTATARHADIVLPCTMTLEREDIGAAGTDPLMVAMHRLAPPFAEARDDYAVFAALAARLGRETEFTQGRSVQDWLRHMYERTRAAVEAQGQAAPDFDTFWSRGELALPLAPDDGGILRAFRGDPDAHPLPTPSGKLELTSVEIAGFGYADCPAHPAWLPHQEQPDQDHPLHLLANQPATRLHSQFDFAAHSAAMKVQGREVLRINPADAAPRGIAQSALVRIFNGRGACLAAADVTSAIRPGVVQLPTGAWFDPVDGMCVHGNPNVLTRDIGTSRLSQGCSGQVTTVQVARYDGNAPPVCAFEPPAFSA